MTERPGDGSTGSWGKRVSRRVDQLGSSRRALAITLVLATALPPTHAQAADPPPSSPQPKAEASSDKSGAGSPSGGGRACVEAHERAQVERLDGRLLEARRALEACAVEGCPAAIQRDCLDWKVELATAIPTVVLEARLDGKPASVAEVRIDDAPLGSYVPGIRVPLDPGPHRAAVRLTTGEVNEVAFELRQGEQNRVLVVDFVTPEAPSVVVEQRVETVRPVPLLTWILLGTTLVGTGVGIAFGADAISQRNAAEADCAPLCDASVSDSVRASALASDIGWIVAGVSAVGATVTYVLRPSVERPAPGDGRERDAAGRGQERGAMRPALVFETRALPGGGLLRFRGSF